MRPRRIAVLGRAGSGKTTTALALAVALDLLAVHLDQLYWTSDRTPVTVERFDARHAAAIATDSWILDGGYMSHDSFADRLRRVDVVVVTEASLARCLVRVVRRTIRHRRRARIDAPPGAAEAFSLTFLLWIIDWSRRHPDLPGEIAAMAPGIPIVVVRDRGDLDRLIAG